MASDAGSTHSSSDKPHMTAAELVALVKHELDADAERQAQVTAEGNGELPQTGATLDLCSRNIHALPVELIGLIKDKVERLALSHNPQITLPSQIIQCNRLRYLNIRWNNLKTFPEAVLQLSSLEILDLSKNRIVTIPEEIKRMTSLKFLAVTRNKITRLPYALGEMPSLSKLKFDDNPIEYPPPEALAAMLVSDKGTSAHFETENEKRQCQAVKQYMRDHAPQTSRLRLRPTTSEDDHSESNVETPRPPRRTAGGRFPVRPSMSGIENIGEFRRESPGDNAPPIPDRSHARDLSQASQHLVHSLRRPSVAPLFTPGGEVNRSRSESVSTSNSFRARRQGFVPSKRSNNLGPTSGYNGGLSSVRTSQASTIRAPPHSRNNSIASTYNGLLAANSGGETSSGAVSPVDGQAVRHTTARRLASLPESRNSHKFHTSDLIRVAKRLLFTLFQLHGPVNRIAVGLKGGTPQRSLLERQLFSANAQVEELDRLIHRLDSGLEEGLKRQSQCAKNITFICLSILKTYGLVVKELKNHRQKIVHVLDPVYTRNLLTNVYAALYELRNIGPLLGYKIRHVSPRPQKKETPRVSKTWSSRTVTPTQVKATPVNRRTRGPTIIQRQSSTATLRAKPPPVPLNGSASRTNTMTSISSAIPISAAATPRSGDSFSTMATSAVPSRSNTVRSNATTHNSSFDDADEEEQFDRIFLKLRNACDLAYSVLRDAHANITAIKNDAELKGQRVLTAHWSMVLSRCNEAILAERSLAGRLKVVRLKDPGVRGQKDFWQLCDSFVQSWANFAQELKDLLQHRIDITAVRNIMKPVQRVIKDVSKTISDSPLYHQALQTRDPRGQPLMNGVPPVPVPPHTLAPLFPAGLNTAFANAVAMNHNFLHGGPTSATSASGSAVSVPATPLSAALGPAAQATVATHGTAAPEYFQGPGPSMGPGIRVVHERNDTVMTPSINAPGAPPGTGFPGPPGPGMPGPPGYGRR